MGGKYCCVVGCHNSNEKTKNNLTRISYFSFPQDKEWRSKLIAAVNRSDRFFNPNTSHICSVHFEEKNLLFHGKGFKLIPGSLPTLYMPKKTIETPCPPPRHPPTKRPSPPVPERVTYLSLSDLQKSIHVKDLHGWSILKTDDNILVFGMYDQTSRSLEKTITVDFNLNVIVRFGEVLLKNKETNLRKISISKFLQEIDNIRKCAGLPDGSYKEKCFRFVSTVVRNVKPEVETVVRSQRCSGGLISDESTPVCSACTSLRGSASDGKSSTMQITVHPKTPLSRLSKEDLIKEVKASRYSFREIQAQVQSLTNGMTETVTNEVGEGLYSSIENNPPEDNFLELFWKEQKKAFQSNPKGMRWHPMMIRFAIFLQYQSSRAYEAIKESGVLKLPNKSTLRDYTNVITPATGFQPHVFEELRKIAADLPSEKRFVALLHDEMKIKSDLVYDRRSGQVIGFTNPDTWTFNEDESMKIATHVLVFMVVGINSHIKMSIGHFPTRISTADELYPLFWSAVAYLEMTCELKVITSTSDKASANQRLYRIHKVGNEPVVFKTKNVFTEEDRYIYFISDAPHLVKTIRNNVYRSKTGGSRYLWNNGRFILWSHVMDIYNDDTRGQLYRTKLTHDHVYLTPSSTMSVKLAVQVLSNSVAQVIRAYYGPEVSETARLFSLVNRFFDCLNVRSLRESVFQRKPDVAPYTSQNDPRFQFLEDEVLEYFNQWLISVRSRPGYKKTEQNKMFISYQTHEGIIMTVKSFIEATRYLLQQGVPYVLSNVFCQDPLEEHFGRHRGLGTRHDNPTIHQFGYQENQLRIQRSLAFNFVPKGNTAGRAGEKRPIVITNSPLKRLKHN